VINTLSLSFMSEPNNVEIGFKKEIWEAADLLRGNLDASEYKCTNLIMHRKHSNCMAHDIKTAHYEGEKLSLTADELAFYDALTTPEFVKDFYSNNELISLTKELTDILCKNKTIDWQKKETAYAVSSNASSKATATHQKRWNTRSRPFLGSVR